MMLEAWDHFDMPQPLGLIIHLGYCALAFLAIRRFVPVKKGWGWQLPLAFCVYLCAGMIIYVGDPVNMLGILPVMPLAFLLCCEGSVHARLSMAFVFYCVFIGLNGPADTLGNPELGGPLARTLYWGGACLLARRFVKQPPALAGRLWAMVNVLTIMPLAAIFIVVLPYGDTYTRIQVLGEAAILALACIAASALLAAVVLFSRHQRLVEEAELHRLQTGYYNGLEETQLAVRRLRHDMANHLAVLAGLPEGEMKPYVQSLIDSPAISATARVCENPVANAVILAKLETFKTLNTEIEIDARLPAACAVQDVDLCALLANSLDNAAEALAKQPEGTRRLVLRMHEKMGGLMLLVQNTAGEPTPQKGGGYATHKADKAAHGLGLKSMAAVAQKYGGTLQTTYKQGIFTLTAAIPL